MTKFRPSEAILFIDRTLAVMAGAAVVTATLTIALGTVTRYFLNSPVPGMHEVIETYGLPMGVMLALGFTFRAGGHVRITLLTRRLSRVWQRRVGYLSAAISLAISIALTYGTATRAIREYSNQSTSSGLMMLPLWVGYLIVFLGLLSLCLVMVLDTFKIRTMTSEFTSTEEDLDAGI